MFTKSEMEATKALAERKMEDILSDTDKPMTDMDLLNLCTLAKLKEAAEKKLGEK